MNLLDRYLFKGVMYTSLGAVSLFGFVLLLGNAIKDLLNLLLAGQISFTDAGELVLLLIPFVISYALPMGVLCGVLLVLGRVSADSEVTAMRASGIGLARIARPVLLFGALGAVVTLYVNFESMPWARVVYDRKLVDAVRSDPLQLLLPRTFIRDFKGAVVHVGANDGRTLTDLTVFELDRQGRAVRIARAREANVAYDELSNELRMTLTEPQIEIRDTDRPEDFTRVPIVGRFSRSEVIHLSLDDLLGRPNYRQKLQWMTYAELKAEKTRVAALEVKPGDEAWHAMERLKVSLAFHDKANTALAVFSFALIGVPLGITVSRRETSANLGLAVLLALGYYVLTVMVGWLDQKPHLRPDLLLWLPNALFIATGLWLFRRAERR